MFDWEIREEALPPEPAAPQPARRPRWRWLLLLLPLVLVVGGVLFWQSRQREAALQRDLQAAIDAEERARSFGLVEEAARFPASGVSERWLDGYRYRFRRDEGDPPLPEVEVVAIELQDAGAHALATVQEGHDQRLRSYQRTRAGWRRSPLPRRAWGDSHTITLGTDVPLHYWDLDAAFATQLAADWPELSNLVAAVPLDEVRIEPVEFRAAAHYDSEERLLRLASPHLVRYDPWLKGAEVVRYDLALELLRAGWPVGAHQGNVAHRSIRDALFEAAALRWALSPARMDSLRGHWRQQVERPWHSPFDTTSAEADTLFVGKPTALSSQGAITMLLGDLLHDRINPPGLRQILVGADLHLSSEWWADRIVAMTGEDRFSLETRLERYVEAGAEAAHQAPVATPPPGPVTVTGRLLAPDSTSDPYLFVPADGGRSWPLLVDGAGLTLPDGTPLARACAPLFETVEVTGRWEGAGFTAERLRAQVVRPPALPALRPIPETALLLALENTAVSQSAGPDGQLFLRLEAVLPDGRRQALYEEGAPISPTRVELDGMPAYTLHVPADAPCRATWLTLVHPEQGYLGPWLVPEPSLSGRWSMPRLFTLDGRQGRWLMVIPQAENRVEAWLLDGGQRLVQSIELPEQPLGLLLGWQAATERLLFWTPRAQPPALLSVALSGDVETLSLPTHQGTPSREVTSLYAPRQDRLVLVTEEHAVVSYALDTGQSQVLLPPPPSGTDGHRFPLALLANGEHVALFDYAGERTPELELVILSQAGELVKRIPWDPTYSALDLSACPNHDALLLRVPINREQSPIQLGPAILQRISEGDLIDLYRFAPEETPLGLACLLDD